VVLVALLAVVVNAAIPAGFKLSPYGYIREECHHIVPSGSRLEARNGGFDVIVDEKFQKHLPKCAYSPEEMFHSRSAFNSQRLPNSTATRKRQFPYDYDGWLAYTQWQYPGASQSVDSFLGSFSVPDEPQSTPDVLYVFTGLQNVPWIPIVDPIPMIFDIIQPVLQYPADSGSGWSAKSWFVTLDIGAVASSEIAFKVGDTVFGNMTRTGQAQYFIDSVNPRTKQHTHISIAHSRLITQPWAYTTIECYGCSSAFGNDCSYLPTKPIHFTGMTLKSSRSIISPVWSAVVSPNPICNTQAHIISPAKVDFSFQ